jgi:hypothetical protein
MHGFRRLLFVLLGLLLSSAVRAQVPCVEGEDVDDDGLDACAELRYGTSPQNPDTDGDGYPDGREVHELGFDADANPYLFNPLIADLPDIQITIEQTPTFEAEFQTTEGTSVQESVGRSSQTSQAYRSTQSSSNTQAVEASTSIGASLTVGAEVGVSGFSPEAKASVEASVSYEETSTSSTETSIGYSSEQSRENTNGYERIRTRASDSSISYTGGRMLTTLKIVNSGSIAYTVKNLAVAVSNRELLTGRPQIIGNLAVDNLASFPSFTVGPRSSSPALVLSKNDLTLSQLSSLLGNSRGLELNVSAFEATDANDRPVAHNLTSVNANTARIMVDYGDVQRPPDSYYVSTTADPDTRRLSARRALAEVLRLPFDESPSGMIVEVDGVRADLAVNARWLVIHSSFDGRRERVTVYDVELEPYDLDGLQLKAGDTLHLVYARDSDRDGLGLRGELLAGTSDELPDTDGDGVNDRAEVAAGLDPTMPDTDRDGVRDIDEIFQSIATWRRGGFLVSHGDRLFSWASKFQGRNGNNRNDVNGAINRPQGDSATNPHGPLPWTYVGAFAALACWQPQDCRIYAWGRGDYYRGNAHGLGEKGNPQPHWVEVPPPSGRRWVDLATTQDEPNSMSMKVALADDGTLWAWGAEVKQKEVEKIKSLQARLQEVRAEHTQWTVELAALEQQIAIVGATPIPFGGSNDALNELTDRHRRAENRVNILNHETKKLVAEIDGLEKGNSGPQRSFPVSEFLGSAVVSRPQQVGNDSDFAEILSAWYFVKKDGTLWGWGPGAWMGQGPDAPFHRVPIQVLSETGWEQVVHHPASDKRGSGTLALRSDGTVWSWGSGNRATLGRPPGDTSSTPQAVFGSARWRSIGWGIGVQRDGSLWKWGVTKAWDGTRLSPGEYAIPTRIGLDDDWIDAVTTPGISTIGLKANGRVYTGGRPGWFAGQGGSESEVVFPTLLDVR